MASHPRFTFRGERLTKTVAVAEWSKAVDLSRSSSPSAMAGNSLLGRPARVRTSSATIQILFLSFLRRLQEGMDLLFAWWMVSGLDKVRGMGDGCTVFCRRWLLRTRQTAHTRPTLREDQTWTNSYMSCAF